jgi:hypothetical protein
MGIHLALIGIPTVDMARRNDQVQIPFILLLGIKVIIARSDQLQAAA